jgi:hypothetical protein
MSIRKLNVPVIDLSSASIRSVARDLTPRQSTIHDSTYENFADLSFLSHSRASVSDWLYRSPFSTIQTGAQVLELRECPCILRLTICAQLRNIAVNSTYAQLNELDLPPLAAL